MHSVCTNNWLLLDSFTLNAEGITTILLVNGNYLRTNMVAQSTYLPAYQHGGSIHITTCLPTWWLSPWKQLPTYMVAQLTELPAYQHGGSTHGTTCIPTWWLNPQNCLPTNVVVRPTELPAYQHDGSTHKTTRYLHSGSTHGTTCIPTWWLKPWNYLPTYMMAQPTELTGYQHGGSTHKTWIFSNIATKNYKFWTVKYLLKAVFLQNLLQHTHMAPNKCNQLPKIRCIKHKLIM